MDGTRDATRSPSPRRWFRRTWATFIAGGRLMMDAARRAIDAALQTEEAFGPRTRYAAADVRLLPPSRRATNRSRSSMT